MIVLFSKIFVLFQAAGQRQPLTIDILGNIMEASDLSPNRTYYGDFHNAGHLFTAYVHDPDHKYLVYFFLKIYLIF